MLQCSKCVTGFGRGVVTLGFGSGSSVSWLDDDPDVPALLTAEGAPAEPALLGGWGGGSNKTPPDASPQPTRIPV
jgi:hypothetical protein